MGTVTDRQLFHGDPQKVPFGRQAATKSGNCEELLATPESSPGRFSVGKLKALLFKGSSSRGGERYRRAGITASSSFITKALNVAISFLSVPLTVHYLGAERYGVWLTISSLLTWMSMTDFGLAGNALINVLAEASGKEDREGAQHYAASAFWALTGVGVLTADGRRRNLPLHTMAGGFSGLRSHVHT